MIVYEHKEKEIREFHWKVYSQQSLKQRQPPKSGLDMKVFGETTPTFQEST